MAAGDVTASVKKNNGKKCASFDGVNDILTRVNDTKFTYTQNDSFSICFLFKSPVWSVDIMLVSKWDGGGYALTIKSSHKIEVHYNSAGATLFQGNTTVDDDKWHHCVCVRNRATDTITLYIDNAADSSATTDSTTGNMPVNPTDFRIGNFIGEAGYLKGKIADVRMYDVAVTAAEISTIYSGAQMLRGLVSVWNFNDGTYNDSYNSNHLTNSGTILQIVDDTIGNQLKLMRVNANSKYLLAEVENGQVMLASIEEA
jgi:hypothetical protein